MYDVVIIGAGVIGCAVARELSKYRLKTIVLEKGEDVCSGTSKANSAIVHAGFDAEPGTWKAKMNVIGSRKMEALSKELDFPYKRNGSLVLCFEEKDLYKLENLKKKGIENGVEGLEIITGEKIWEMEPNLSKNVKAMLYAPTGAIICPFKLTIALAENANINGVEFAFDTEVKNIQKTTAGYTIETTKEYYETKCIVNAAGVYADIFHNMVSEEKLTIIPRRLEILYHIQFFSFRQKWERVF